MCECVRVRMCTCVYGGVHACICKHVCNVHLIVGTSVSHYI